MITIKTASIYSSKGSMCYQLTYSDGTNVRAVTCNGMIRKEHKQGEKWVLSGKPYTITHNRKRQAERVVETVKYFLSYNAIKGQHHA